MRPTWPHADENDDGDGEWVTEEEVAWSDSHWSSDGKWSGGGQHGSSHRWSSSRWSYASPSSQGDWWDSDSQWSTTGNAWSDPSSRWSRSWRQTTEGSSVTAVKGEKEHVPEYDGTESLRIYMIKNRDLPS